MRDDSGAATLLVVAAGLVLSVMAVAVGAVATGLAVHRQVVRAADLAALAGADRSLTNADVACQAARVVASANGATLDVCHLEPAALRVTVRVEPPGWLPAFTATARAGLAVS